MQAPGAGSSSGQITGRTEYVTRAPRRYREHMGNVQIECTKTDVYWVHCQICGTDGPRTEDRAEADRQHTEHHRMHNADTGGAMPVSDEPGTFQVDDRGIQVLVHVVPPNEWLALDQLRHWAAFLTAQADECERGPEVEELSGILETAIALGNPSPRAMARVLHGSGYRLERVTA